MSVSRDDLAAYLDDLLGCAAFADYAPNGLQIEGRSEVEHLVTGVSANQALIDASVERGADALLVHHGFFWKNEPRTLTGIRARRVRSLLAADVSLFGYHLPLDAHPDYGNNVGVLRAIGAEPSGTFSAGHAVDGWLGTLVQPTDLLTLCTSIRAFSVGQPQVFDPGSGPISTVGVCTGGGAGFFEAAVAAGCDAFISGEASEMAQGLSRELGVPFIAAGHHATERFGPQLLGRHLGEKFDLHVEFVDISNPI
jgi:dinuclear metal center YbgI/SA1388 family protein